MHPALLVAGLGLFLLASDDPPPPEPAPAPEPTRPPTRPKPEPKPEPEPEPEGYDLAEDLRALELDELDLENDQADDGEELEPAA